MEFYTNNQVGYKGHQPQWRTEEWDHIQAISTLPLRVKPMMRMPLPALGLGFGFGIRV